jgi:hypothetical protein
LISEVAGEIVMYNGSRCGVTDTTTGVLTTLDDLDAPDERLVDLESMEAGEIRDTELTEELDSSSFLPSRPIYLAYDKTEQVVHSISLTSD